jgi:hypothetical protein
MFGRRRRPLARAAVVGGGAYAIGKRRANQQNQEQEEAYAAQAPPEPEGITNDAVSQIEKLGKLKEEGLLTQAEFDEQKAKILNA